MRCPPISSDKQKLRRVDGRGTQIFLSSRRRGTMIASSKVKAMAETLDKVSKRLTELEVTVAKGFHEAELRDIALSRKVDVTTESLRGEIRTVLDAVGSLADEMRRTTDSIRAEHAADRTILTLAIEQHATRLFAPEQKDRDGHDER